MFDHLPAVLSQEIKRVFFVPTNVVSLLKLFLQHISFSKLPVHYHYLNNNHLFILAE